jgi:myo-inositol-1(or 4)-monophosphatase
MTRGSISFKHLRIVEQTIIRRKTLATDFEFAQSLVRRAGELIKKSVSAGGYTSAWKDDNTPVTSIDIAVNKLVISELGRQYPQDRVYGEEESADAETPSGMTWVLDPIDGTQALEQGIDAFTCCLARLDAGGQPLFSLIYNPSKDQLFAARRGEAATLNGAAVKVSGKDNIKGSYVYLGSRIHGDGLATNGQIYDRLEGAGGKVLNLRAIAFGCTQVAAGLAEGAYIGVKTPFEAASATLIVEGAGGHVTDLYGNAPGRLDGEIKGLVVSNGLIHNDLLGALR